MLRFAKDHKVLFLRSSLVRFINSEEHLQFIMVDDRRKDPLLVAEATSIIERHFWLQGTENTENIDSSEVVWEDIVQIHNTHIPFSISNSSRK